MTFDGALLERGFWLYVWRIADGSQEVLYVGRTGDSSSMHASSPFRRIGQHLELKENAKANAMARRLRERGLKPSACGYAMTAIGPLFPEQPEMASHQIHRDRVAGLEMALAGWLRSRGYDVLGAHASRHPADAALLHEITLVLEAEFPQRARPDT